MDRREELMRAEDEGWHRMQALWSRLSPEQMEEPGMIAEGWSVKDLLWHIGAWWAEAGRMLERMRAGTYVAEDDTDWGTDEKNARFLAEGRKVDLATVKAELFSARSRALQDLTSLPEITPAAEEWFGESGTQHYSDHDSELEAWVDKLTSAG